MKDWLDTLQHATSAALLILGAAGEHAKQGGWTVNAAGIDRSTACAGVTDFVLTPGATLADMRLSWTCPDDRKRRLCQPAEATPPAAPGTPAIAMYPASQLVSLACAAGSLAVEAPRLQITVDGVGETCASVTSLHTTVIAADQCVPGAGAAAATCLRWTCEGSPVERACFPLRPVSTVDAPIGSGATTSTVVECEQATPLLVDGFD